MNRTPYLLTAIYLFAGSPVLSQNTNPGESAPPAFDYEAIRLGKVVTAYRITEEITLDGRLDEAAWDLAVPATEFYQWQRVGELATEQTEVRILYDDDIYFGVICFDSQIEDRVVNGSNEGLQFPRDRRFQRHHRQPPRPTFRMGGRYESGRRPLRYPGPERWHCDQRRLGWRLGCEGEHRRGCVDR